MKRLIAALLMAGAVAPAIAADWKAVEIVRTYAIVGTTGAELYASIGEKGPTIVGGTTRTIAFTTFDLKWSRNYVPQGSTCRLVSARPSLAIIYTLPKPSQTLPPATKRAWQAFVDGILAHEKVHGADIRAMVDRIVATTVGFAMADDPACRKIREAIKAPLKAASDEQRRKSRDFDAVEMSPGGNVHQLILGLVNGS